MLKVKRLTTAIECGLVMPTLLEEVYPAPTSLHQRGLAHLWDNKIRGDLYKPLFSDMGLLQD
jgi:hypothetical protein